MNCMSARDSRASPPFSTTKRAPDNFEAAASKSISPSASPISKCSLRLEPLGENPRFRRPSGATPAYWSFSSQTVRNASEAPAGWESRRAPPQAALCAVFSARPPIPASAPLIAATSAFSVSAAVAASLRASGLPDLLRRGVAALLRFLQVADRRAAAVVHRDQVGGAGRQAPAREAGIEGRRVVSYRLDVVHGCSVPFGVAPIPRAAYQIVARRQKLPRPAQPKSSPLCALESPFGAYPQGPAEGC